MDRTEHRRSSPDRALPAAGASLVTLLLASVLAAALPLSAQDGSTDAMAQATAALQFRTIGPTIMGGRVADLAVVEDDPRIFYVAVATGGVWKTENAGITFEHVFRDEATASVGDVTLAPSNPNVVWVGTGEPNNRQSSPWGNGVYRSTDAGRTWTHVGLENTHTIARIQVHPRDPDVAYVAAVGHLWGPNPERGVYRTTDGGETWEHVLSVDDDTGATELVMDPADPRTLFAATYQRRRRAWGFNGGGPGSGIYRTTDGGDTWTELTEGLPEGDKGRIGLDIYRRDGNVVFALVEADARAPGQGFGGGAGSDAKNGVYRSNDRGETWEHLSTTNNRPMYYSQIRVDPNDPERIYLGGSSLFRSSDGGRNFTPDAAAEVHLDHHALWIDPADSDHLILAGDGGVSISWDRADNWYQLRNLPIGQFYEIGVDMRDPYHVCGGLQDNGSWCAPSDTWSNQGIRTRDWYNVGSGDGFFTVMHPTNPDLMFAESQGGNLTRVDLATGERARIRPLPRPTEEEADRSLRWNWDTPMLLSAHDDQVVYAGANVLFRSTDLGQSWEEISGDLTYAIDRDTLMLMGVAGGEPQMSRNDGQSNYGNLTAIAESPLDFAVLYTGSDDGRVHVTRDAGATWTDITGNVPGLPPYTYVTRLVASRGAQGEVFAAFDGHRSDDFAPYVYASTDFGETWERITDGLPATSLNALAQHPHAHNLLFAGSEVGVHFSIDRGATWHDLRNGLPTVPVDDIVVHPRENDLVIGTHGLGIWIMDDIGPLQHLSAEVMASAAHLYPVRRATSYNLYTPQGWTPGIYAAPNPPAGARIRYHLGADGDSVTVTIRDGDGASVHELKGSGDAGLNEVIWDLRLAAEGADGEAMDPGPRVLPGSYTVALTAGDATLETPAEVRLDPRVEISRFALMARHSAMMDSYRLSGAVSDARGRMGEMREQLSQIDDRVAAAAEAPGELTEAIEAFREDLEALQDDIGGGGGFGGFGGGSGAAAGASVWATIERASSSPTADQLWQIDRSWEELPPIIERLNELVTERLPALNAKVYAEGLRPKAGEAVAMPRRER
ncbi:MAG: hypothetical protein OXU74_14210 [Gemmatimonadota bacterium]|nr:hypothetical protein [Gemmatimonadota bacterium]